MEVPDNSPIYTDLVAEHKFQSREWFCNPSEGKIYDRKGEIYGSISGGYLRVKTTFRGKDVNISKHRAVWIAGANFGLAPEDPTLVIDHINGNKLDNRIDNLHLVTPKQNSANPNAPGGLRGERHPAAKITNEQADEIRRRYHETRGLPKGRGRLTCRALAYEYGISHQQISRIIRGVAFGKIDDRRMREAEA